MRHLDFCQWIEGDPGFDDKGKCSLPVAEGSPYCPEHRTRSVLPADCPERLMAVAQLRLDLLIAGLSPQLIDHLISAEKE